VLSRTCFRTYIPGTDKVKGEICNPAESILKYHWVLDPRFIQLIRNLGLNPDQDMIGLQIDSPRLVSHQDQEKHTVLTEFSP
jgi:hypothetical protein